jgi:FkbM family methyltransferase
MKRAIQSLLNELGFEVHRISWFPSARRFRMIRELGINLVLDVGANNGGYALGLRESGYRGAIWSYEPLHDVFAVLDKAAAGDDLWKTVNSACGSKACSAKINVSKNRASSSLLSILPTCLENAPETEYESQETISVCSLDETITPSLSLEDKVWLKMDTQGYEAEVLNGATRLISHVQALECELSLVPLYEGQPLIGEMIAMIYQMGFRLVGVAPAFFEPKTGYALQVDGTFLRV